MELTSRKGAAGWGSRFAGLVSAVLLLGVVATAVGELPRDRANSRPDGRGLVLSTTPNSETMDRNRVILLLQDNAEIGSSGSSVAGGGFWITTTDQYVFSAGPNIGALLPDGTVVVAIGGPFSELEAGGPVFDGIGLDEYFATTNPEDEGNFPSVCTVDDFRVEQFPSLASFGGDPFPGFADKTVCIAANDIQGGTCADCGGTRVGVEIVETIFAFGVPSVQDFVFFALRIFNRTEFLNAGNAPVQPAGPYDLTDTIVAFAIDPDVGSAGDDQIAFIPEVQTMVYWDSDFTEPQFQNTPGFGGITYLKTPIDPNTGEEVGLAEFTVFTNGNPRPDPTNKEQWYALMTGDPSEVVLEVDPRDVRGMASSAPFPLPAGEFVEIYGAFFFATVTGAPPGQLLAEGYKNLVTGELIPTANQNVAFNNFKNVQLTAQATFDAGFVVPTAPPKPEITLIPGDGQVTVAWEPGPTTAVNPFAKVARDPFARLPDGSPDPGAGGTGVFLGAEDIIFDPSRDTGGTSGFVSAATAGLTGAEVTNAAYNPNFLIQDFQGFNVYSSVDGINTTLIAQFDNQDGIVGGTFCTNATAVFDSQTPPGLAGVVCTAQTQLNIGTDNGLNFAIVDRGGAFPDPSTGPGVVNGIPRFYTVTSFAVNPGQSPVSLPSQAALDQLNASSTPAAPLVLEAGQAPLLQATPRSNASSFVNAVPGATSIVDATGTPLSGNNVAMPLDPNTGLPTGPLPGANTIALNVTVVDPLLIPSDFGELRLEITGADARFNCLSAPGACNNYDTDVCGCGFGAAFDQLLGVDVRGRAVEFQYTDANGTVLQTLEGTPAAGTVFTDFFSFTGVGAFGSPTFAIVFPDAPDEIAFTTSWSSSVGDRSTQCARGGTCALLDANRTALPTSVANVSFQVGAYGQYGYGDIELTWSNQGGVLSLSSVRDLSNGVDYAFDSTFGCEACWGFAAETGLGAAEEGLAAAIGGVPRTASGKVLYPDPLFTFLGGQNTSFGGVIQGAAHWTDLAFDPEITGPNGAIASPGFPQFRDDRLQPDAFQQTAALFTCPGAGGGFGCGGAGAGLQGTRLYVASSYLDLAFNTLPADGEVWIAQMGNGVATTSRPPIPGQAVTVPLQGGSNNLSDADLSAITVVPNPFIAANEITRGQGLQRILFTQLPPQATIRIYTISGNLIRVLEHSDGSGTMPWDVRTRFDLLAASGNYYFHVTTPDGRTHLGRFAVVN